MPDEESTHFEALDEVICRLTPDLFQAYEQEKLKYRQAIADEQEHFKHAQRYLKTRQAPREEYDNLIAQREVELRRLRNQFAVNTRGLLDRFGGCSDC